MSKWIVLRIRRRFFGFGVISLLLGCLALAPFDVPVAQAAYTVTEDSTSITISEPTYKITIDKAGFKYAFKKPDNTVIAGAHPTSGLLFSAPNGTTLYSASTSTLVGYDTNRVQMLVTNSNGNQADVYIFPRDDYNKFQIVPRTAGAYIIDARTAAVGKGYGLGDFGGASSINLTNNNFSDVDDTHRFISNFVVYPAQGFGQVLFEEGKKRVGITSSENRLGVDGPAKIDRLYYFVGNLSQIYAEYKTAKAYNGFNEYKPKYDFFEVGWEAFGALGWDTNQTTVTSNLQTYLDKGYRLKWGVIGSKFWRGDPTPTQAATTRFGLWDDGASGSSSPPRYPDPAGLKTFFHSNGLKLFLGMRISMESSNPYYQEALNNNYFIAGASQPSDGSKLLNLKSSTVLNWYKTHQDLWGVDGFKEDLCCGGGIPYTDDKINDGNEALMQAGYYIMVRNTAYAVPGEISRLEDTTYSSGTSRIVSLSQAYAASAAPNFYPDIVAGKYLTYPLTEDQKVYFVRNSTLDAVMPSMSLGFGPWQMDNTTYEGYVKAAADWHSKFAPYIYSAAIDSYNTGFPYTLTPMQLAYPDQTNLYDMSQKQWMLGPSLMATDCYSSGSPYPTTCTKTITLPPGKWVDYNSGTLYQGPTTISNYDLPLGKLGLFVGGKGVVVFRDLTTNALNAKVYPVVNGGSQYKFTDTNGTTTSTITNNNIGWNSATMTIIDTTANTSVAFSYEAKTGAFKFLLTPGHNYSLTNGN